MDKHNSDWMTGGPWYKTSICKKLHGKLFEGFIMNPRTDIYHIMCSTNAHEEEYQSAFSIILNTILSVYPFSFTGSFSVISLINVSMFTIILRQMFLELLSHTDIIFYCATMH